MRPLGDVQEERGPQPRKKPGGRPMAHQDELELLAVVDQWGNVVRITHYTPSLPEDDQVAYALREATADMDAQCLHVQFP